MRALSCTIVFILAAFWGIAQSPHGSEFDLDCALCHTSDSWKVDKEAVEFNHDRTSFKLIGQHQQANCRSCHIKLVFANVENECSKCHSDVHDGTLSLDCSRCHTPDAWQISNIGEIHQRGRFELLGAHKNVDCSLCHKQADELKFEPMGIECVNCHMADFDRTENPNHKLSGFSMNCLECHSPDSKSWDAEPVDHDFFSLTGGHSVGCIDCHTTGLFNKIPTNCSNCHQANYDQTKQPDHHAAGMPFECETCHNINAWVPSQFNHTTTGFELNGAHKNIEQCSSCHVGVIDATKPECISCHQSQYDVAPDHKSGGFPTECLQCHTTESWSAASFDHSKTNFPLIGKHISVECASCHANGYSGTSTQCNSCHIENYNQAASPNHADAGISTQCEECHTPSAWKPSAFNHSSTGFELTGGHAKIDQCSRCHMGTTSNANSACISCHQSQYDIAPDHKSGGFPTECLQCHTTESWSAASFDHSKTNFPLIGKHISVECASCHANGYSGTSTQCNSCHIENYHQAGSPNHTDAGISTQCEECHTPAAWKPSAFNHSSTGFELTGGHAKVDQCSRCHKGTTSNASSACIRCHQSQYDIAPDHKSGGFPTECLQCHTTESWSAASFDHSKTNFPLVGKHTIVECASCHASGYAGTSTQCYSCHFENYNQSGSPNHADAGISTQCEECHTPSDWKPSAFNHSSTGFELTGGHAKVDQCSQCHVGTTSNANSACISCHQTQYNQAPDHSAQQFPTNCIMCHTTENWLEANFDHSQTGFPLTGLHVSVACASCHTNGFAGTSTECASCHQNNYNSAQSPDHSSAGIPASCEDCHSPSGWKPSSFDHITTGFELTGNHRNVEQCFQCHKGSLVNASPECISCHQVQYDYAPEHKQYGYPVECTLCHTTNNWLETNFNHNNTAFPLTGQHIGVECSSCHTSGFAGTPMNCNDCHSSDYSNAQLPVHTAAGIPSTCEDCHATSGWRPSSFNHSSTGFVLTGGHATVGQCSECHKGSVTNTSSECISCHQSQYNGAPDHVSMGYPQSCTMCHTTNNWLETNFDHSKTNFPLTGAHRNAQCSDCHTSGFSGTSINCYSCHQSDYSSTSNPNHAAAHFPTDCQSCHTTNAWQPASFNHDAQYFPIYSGKHRGEWNSCADCHTNSSDYAVFSCIDCHEHNKSSMDSEHRGKSGYVYLSSACYSCHPDGRD